MTISELFQHTKSHYSLRLSYGNCWLHINENGTFSVFQQEYRKHTRKIAENVTEKEAVAILIERTEV